MSATYSWAIRSPGWDSPCYRQPAGMQSGLAHWILHCWPPLEEDCGGNSRILMKTENKALSKKKKVSCRGENEGWMRAAAQWLL